MALDEMVQNIIKRSLEGWIGRTGSYLESLT